jgi:hypothetical protein
MKRITILLAICLVVSGLLTTCRKKNAPFDQPEKYVVYLGFNFSDTAKARKSNYQDSLHIVALQQQLSRLNDSAYGIHLRLRTIQCDFKEDTIARIYQTIAADTNNILVIDNTWGRHIRHAAEYIRDKIPVIAMSADQNSLDFGNNAIFLDPNDPQPVYLIKFLKHALKAKRVGFISETDYLLHRRFETLFREEHLECDTLLRLLQSQYVNNEVPESVRLTMEHNLERVLTNPADSILLLNTHSGYGNAILQYLIKAKNIPPKTIIGLPGITNIGDAELERLTKQKGHTIIRFETAIEAPSIGQYMVRKKLQAQYPARFFSSRTVDNQLRRCYDAMNILETALELHHRDRSTLVSYFKSLKDRKIAIYNELYEFDSTMILKRDPGFDQIQNGKTRSCPTQINTSGEPIPNLRVGIDVIDINEIDVRKNTFDCNLLYWVIAESKYIDKEGYIDFENLSSDEANKYRIAEEHDGDYIIRIYRVSGKFLGNFHTAAFPFDEHEVRIPISAMNSSEKIKVSFDFSRLQIKSKKQKFQFNDWKTSDYYVTLDNQLTNQLGSLDKITFDTANYAQYLEKYKNLNIRLKVSRRPWGALILIVFPFLMFSALPIFMLFFHKASYEESGEFIITSFLAAVAYSINLVQLSPTTDSMNTAYVILLITLGINFFCFLYVTYMGKQVEGKILSRLAPIRGRIKMARVLRWVLLAVIGMGVLFLWLGR